MQCTDVFHSNGLANMAMSHMVNSSNKSADMARTFVYTIVQCSASNEHHQSSQAAPHLVVTDVDSV